MRKSGFFGEPFSAPLRGVDRRGVLDLVLSLRVSLVSFWKSLPRPRLLPSPFPPPMMPPPDRVAAAARWLNGPVGVLLGLVALLCLVRRTGACTAASHALGLSSSRDDDDDDVYDDDDEEDDDDGRRPTPTTTTRRMKTTDD